MALASIVQSDFGAGIWRQRLAPAGAVYDAQNCLINSLGQLYKRGGSAYWSGSNAGNTLVRLSALYYPALNASRVTAAGGGHLYAFNGTTPVDLGSIATPGRPASVGAMAVFPIGAGGRLAYYAGSLKTASYLPSAGKSVSTTAGSAVVTGTSTAFTTNVDAGMILYHSSSGRMLVVKSVDSDTQVTLTTPWPTTNSASTSFTFYPIIDSNTTLSFPFPTLSGSTYVAAAGAGLPKLIVTTGNRAYESSAEDASKGTVTFDADVYHELPSSVEITGAEGVGDSCLLFTTLGVYRIDNVSLSPVDDYGNQQQSVVRVTEDIVLWGDLGVTGWEGGVIVPATDDVRLMGADGSSVSLTGDPKNSRVRDLYRGYSATAGYHPGRATVFAGHLFLPICDSSDAVQDTLVCRLDRNAAWTRFSGQASGTAFAVLPRTSSAAPKLLGLSSQRVTDLTGVFSPTASNSQDADAASVTATVITNDIPTQDGIVAAMARRARLLFELTEDGTHTAPTVSLAVSSDQDADSYTTLTEKGVVGSTGTGGATSDGSKPHWWSVNKRRTRIRFKITTSGAAATFILRGFELLLRPTGRQ